MDTKENGSAFSSLFGPYLCFTPLFNSANVNLSFLSVLLKMSLSPEWYHLQVDLETVHSVLLTMWYAKCIRKDRPTITEQINLNLSTDLFIIQYSLVEKKDKIYLLSR